MRNVTDDKIEVEVQIGENAPTFSLIIKCLAIVERMCLHLPCATTLEFSYIVFMVDSRISAFQKRNGNF